VLIGGPRGDELIGGSGDDELVGDAGHDRLDGGEGVDACSGDPGAGTERGCEHAVFALAGRLPLVELGARTVGYGYHQSLFQSAIGLRPFGSHVVMGSRGRGTGSTTAADVVVPSLARVRSPVTGEVVGVKRYLLYCERPDWKLVIRPDSDPSLRVLVLHLGRPRVADGADVLAGISRLGRARPSDWADSQKNEYFPARYPHVHVEVERDRASPTPGCSI
jgi:Ca2+-binding RTX toxin-like protein